ncbi:GDSL-type esterase/lipase family protein [Tumidithrix elongata RA019]|uniref:GDSL-type esterase/lipase family protein n=1 Tax=Tumidithrix elongata BACA0141 TaxID=2716417 RepID=A0AAW9PR37_9CYAN|nr:GDSL-type esterase/lipase family protein [Tumidithrix elongata RA019]
MTTLNLLKAPTISSRSHQPLRVTAFGDSLIYGYGDPVHGGWVEQLRRQWMGTETGHVLYNLGVRGDTVSHVNHRLEQEFLLRGELRNKIPDLMILSVGVNDSARVGKRESRTMTDYDRFTLEIVNLLDKAQNLCPTIFVGMVPVDESKMPFLDCLHFNHEDQFRYKEMTKLACQVGNIPYLDIFDLWQERGQTWMRDRICQDGLHPNTNGYLALLEDICSWQPLMQLGQVSAS